jgi:hypothetical protein
MTENGTGEFKNANIFERYYLAQCAALSGIRFLDAEKH